MLLLRRYSKVSNLNISKIKEKSIGHTTMMIIFLSISFNMCFGCSIEYPQDMFWLRNKKNDFKYALLSKGLNYGVE